MHCPVDLKFCWATSFHPYSPNLRFWKDKFSRQLFKVEPFVIVCRLKILKVRALYLNFPLSFEKEISNDSKNAIFGGYCGIYIF